MGTYAEQVLDAGGDSAEGRVAGGLEAGITDDGAASGPRAANGAPESSSEAPSGLGEGKRRPPHGRRVRHPGTCGVRVRLASATPDSSKQEHCDAVQWVRNAGRERGWGRDELRVLFSVVTEYTPHGT